MAARQWDSGYDATSGDTSISFNSTFDAAPTVVGTSNSASTIAKGSGLDSVTTTGFVGYTEATDGGLEWIAREAGYDTGEEPDWNVDTGSYTQTGQAAGLQRHLRLQCSTGSYAQTGQTADLDRTVRLAAATGSYTVTGQDVAYSGDVTIAATTGSYILSGVDAALQYNSVLGVDAGSYALTGQSASLDKVYTLSAVTGAYQLNPPVLVVQDTFTDVTSTALDAHTPDLGDGWTILNGSPNIGSNKLRFSSTYQLENAIIDAGVPVTNVYVDVDGWSNTWDYLGVYLRYIDTNNFIRVRVNLHATSGSIEVYSIVGGSWSTITTWDLSIPQNFTIHAWIGEDGYPYGEIVGLTSPIFAFDDISTLVADTNVGVYSESHDTEYLDNFEAYAPGPNVDLIYRNIAAATGAYTLTGAAAGLNRAYTLSCEAGSYAVTPSGASQSTAVYDTFTEISNTNLASHTPDTDVEGGGWSTVGYIIVNGSSDTLVPQQNYCRAWIDAGGDDVIVSCNLYANATETGRAFICARGQYLTSVRAQWNVDTSEFLLLVNGVTEDSISISGTGWKTVTLTCQGTSITATISGGSRALTATSSYGIGVDTVGLANLTQSWGWNFDNFQADVVSADNVALIANRNIDTAAGSYSLTGVDADLQGPGEVLQTAVGSYSLTGQAASLDRLYHLDPVVGSYILTGQNPHLTREKYTHVETGSYTLTGVGVDLDHTGHLHPAVGSYTLAGSAAGLAISRYIGTNTGFYLSTGISADLTLFATIDAATGAYLWTGQTAALLVDRHVGTETGTYVLSGQNSHLAREKYTHVETGSYTLTGVSVDLDHDWHLHAAVGSYTLTGAPADLDLTRRFVLDTGSYTLTGAPADLDLTRRFVLDTGSYTLTGVSVDLDHDWHLHAATGSYTLTGQPVSYSSTWILPANSGTYLLYGLTPQFTRQERLDVLVGGYTILGQTAQLASAKISLVETGSYIVTGQTADLDRAKRLVAETGSYTVTGQAADLERALQLALGTGSYTLTGQSVDTDRAVRLTATVGSYTTTGADAGLLRNKVLKLETGSYVATGQDVNFVIPIYGTADQTIAISQIAVGEVPREGTVTQSFGGMFSQAAVGEVTAGTDTGEIIQTFSSITQIAQGNYVPGTDTGTIEQLITGLMQSAVGETSPPVTGSITQTISLSQAAVGECPRAGTIVQTISISQSVATYYSPADVETLIWIVPEEELIYEVVLDEKVFLQGWADVIHEVVLEDMIYLVDDETSIYGNKHLTIW